MSQKIKYEAKSLCMLLFAVVISFVSLHIFVIPSDFSPSGVDGISTILYEITGINAGWFKLIINLPLMVLALIYLKGRYTLYVILFTILDSAGLIFLEEISFYTFIPEGIAIENAVGYRLLSAIFSGLALGVCTGIMLKLNCSTGGIDILACLINRIKPSLNIERIISIACYIIICLSYFVYRDLTSILLAVIQIFVFEWTVSTLMRKERYAVEVKIITKEPEKIRKQILNEHRHSATVLNAEGMFSGDDYYMVITVLDEKNLMSFMQTMKQYPETFVYFSGGVKVQGDFHFGTDVVKKINIC